MNFKKNQNVFQIFLSDDIQYQLEGELLKCTQSIKNNSKELNYFIFNKTSLEVTIKEFMPSEVYQAYKLLRPFSYKADLGRYCLLYLFGGWYFDISVSVTSDIPIINGLSHVVFRDAPNPVSQTWDTSTSVIYAEAGSSVMFDSIKQVVENCNNKWYGVNPLCPTGPSVLGRSLALRGPDHSVLSGMLLTLTPKHNLKNNAFVLPDGQILAWGKKTWGTIDGNGLSALGAKGTDSYSELYFRREIFNE